MVPPPTFHVKQWLSRSKSGSSAAAVAGKAAAAGAMDGGHGLDADMVDVAGVGVGGAKEQLVASLIGSPMSAAESTPAGSPATVPPLAAKSHFSVKGTPFCIESRYSFIKALGLGAYGVVCAVSDSVTGKKVAVKKVSGVFEDLTDAKRIIREIRLLGQMNHENILTVLDMDEPADYMTFNDVYIVTELMDTDLNKLLRSKHPLLEAQCKYFGYQLLRALLYIHSVNIIHRDIKPANVLVNENCDVKLCTFASAVGLVVCVCLRSRARYSSFGPALEWVPSACARYERFWYMRLQVTDSCEIFAPASLCYLCSTLQSHLSPPLFWRQATLGWRDTLIPRMPAR